MSTANKESDLKAAQGGTDVTGKVILTPHVNGGALLLGCSNPLDHYIHTADFSHMTTEDKAAVTRLTILSDAFDIWPDMTVFPNLVHIFIQTATTFDPDTVVIPSTVTDAEFIDCGFTTFPSLAGMDQINDFEIRGTVTALTEAAINTLLQEIDAFGTSGGYCDFTGGTNAAPSGAGATAMDNLVGRGWEIDHN